MNDETHHLARRSFLLGIGALTLTACGQNTGAGREPNRPTILAHGGGLTSQSVGNDLARLSGGKGARVLLVPYAARDPVSEARLGRKFLGNFGFRNVHVLDIADPAQAVQEIGRADAIWYSGGSQKNQVLRLKSVPAIHEALLSAYSAGTVMAGGSAGAAVMSKLMISGGTGGAVYTRPGLGFWPEVVLDQHVQQRGREYRLLKVIERNPHLIGVGLDEGTWVVYRDGMFVVSGTGFAHVVTYRNGQLFEDRLGRGKKYDISGQRVF